MTCQSCSYIVYENFNEKDLEIISFASKTMISCEDSMMISLLFNTISIMDVALRINFS